ncbi:hypothetical protein [Parendozoicomonas haliclonae]|uniref:Uncharacterized protein n=1 Tax=Parendozoicomonas haliclonae TaxID=1960125 RepID=A0A1X7AL65_9GAMM|nr:hypothetical protein [Parendozoicomonas haliclonae]SMA48643.1 hypothetical protein EHSB41UT_02828 [Parendozoicomonas haliclonae]
MDFRRVFAFAALLLSCGSFAEFRESDCDTKTCIDQVPLVKDKYWSTGILVGSVSASLKTGGVFYTSGELEFLLGGGLPDKFIGRYPPEIYDVSVVEEDEALWYILRGLDDRDMVVLNYTYPFVHNPLKSKTKYLIYSYDANESFDFSKSYQRYPDGIVDRASYKQEALFNRDGLAAGLILHVSRWGLSPYKRRCTVYLHRGGMRVITRDKYFKEDVSYVDGNGDTQVRKEYRTEPVKERVPHLMMLNTLNEDVCAYAEDAARGVKRVRIEFSGSESSQPQYLTGVVLHSIAVIEESQDAQ